MYVNTKILFPTSLPPRVNALPAGNFYGSAETGRRRIILAASSPDPSQTRATLYARFTGPQDFIAHRGRGRPPKSMSRAAQTRLGKQTALFVEQNREKVQGSPSETSRWHNTCPTGGAIFTVARADLLQHSAVPLSVAQQSDEHAH